MRILVAAAAALLAAATSLRAAEEQLRYGVPDEVGMSAEVLEAGASLFEAGKTEYLFYVG